MDLRSVGERWLDASKIKLLAMAACLAAFFAGGVWTDPLHHLRARGPDETPANETPDDSLIPDAKPGEDDAFPRQADSRAETARTDAIRRTSAALRAECRRAAGGNWEKWQRDTAPYRAQLRSKIAALKDFPRRKSDVWEGLYPALEGIGGFPLFEVGAREHLNHLFEPRLLDRFRHDQSVVAAHRWLRQRGVDLIFVPAPKMAEVYIEHFLSPAPPDGIIAPHLRKTIFDLLNHDVEVIDGFSLFREQRDSDTEYLYNTADSHWAPRGMRIMAKEIADRIERYDFGARARYGLPIVRTSPGPYLINGALGGMKEGRAWSALTPEQQARARAVQTTTLSEVRLPDGSVPPDDPTSPVMVIGHSYARTFRYQLVKELNLRIHARIRDGETTGFFEEFLRDPDVLKHCRVIVWITTEQHLTRFQELPEPITREVGTIY